LRNEIVPRLQERWPGFAAMAGRSSQLCAEQEQLCEELAAQDLLAIGQDDGSLTLSALAIVTAATPESVASLVATGWGGSRL